MARIDIKTLVLAFEKRISALEKNPPDKVPMSVILDLLERAVEEVIRNHFAELIRQEMEHQIKEELDERCDEYVRSILQNVFEEESFKQTIENNVKSRIIRSFDR